MNDKSSSCPPTIADRTMYRFNTNNAEVIVDCGDCAVNMGAVAVAILVTGEITIVAGDRNSFLIFVGGHKAGVNKADCAVGAIGCPHP